MTSTTDLIDSAIWSLSLDDKIKVWELIEQLIKESQLPQQEICISCDEQKETHKICMDCIGKMIKENQKEISDEEIEKAVNKYAEVYQCPSEVKMCKHDVISAWNNAIKWYREQLKNKI